MTFEAQDSFTAVEAKASGLNGIGDFSQQDLKLLDQFNKNMANNLDGILPQLSFNMADGASDASLFQAPLPGKDITTKQMKESGVRASESKNDDGSKTITGDYPTGVRVHTTDAGKPQVKDSGNVVTVTESDGIEATGDVKPKDKDGNVWVDAKGREIAKRNDDGSWTVDSGEGFYRQSNKGIEKVSVIRSRDGKTFEEINTKDPLGDMKPSDMPKVKGS
ncbi:MAG: hypothetical protein C0507_24445 [Cyanobacteria bacterium PR.3.49]|nr:hypothetical protein [Cyanobacteria bacterium PR.3.49]